MLQNECAKVLNSTEGAHIKNVSTFETGEHLHARDLSVVGRSHQKA
jgi:hypothetical protein